MRPEHESARVGVASTAAMRDPVLLETVNRRLAMAWIDFESGLATVPLIDKLNRGRLRLADYQRLLVNLRQQVVDGSRWIARAASWIGPQHAELRSLFMRHAATEHRDYELLEHDFVATGGALEAILGGEKNLGSEALSAWMFHAASRPDPFGMLGAMFIIEGLGRRLAAPWAAAIQKQLGLGEDCVRFLRYHGANDDDHMAIFDRALELVLNGPEVADSIVRHARVTARLYRLQLEELDNV